MGDLPIGGVAVEVKADLSKLGPGFAEGRAQAQAFDKDVAAAMAKAGSATANLTAHQQALVAQLVAAKTTAGEAAAIFGKTADSQKLLAAFTQASSAALKTQASAIGNVTAAQKQLNATVSGGAKTYENFFNGNFVDQWKKGADAVGKTTTAYKLNQMQVQELVGAARHSLDALAAGASPVRVLATHMATLAQSAGSGEGGVAAALGALGRIFTPTVIGLGAVAGATALAAKATYDYEKALTQLGQLSKGVGASAGLNAQQLEKIAEQGAGAQSGLSVGQNRAFEAQLLATGQIGGQVFQGLIDIQKKYAVATGQDLKKAQVDLVKMFEDPTKGAEELERLFGKLSASEIQHVRDLQAGGNMAGAQAAEYQLLAKSVGGLSDQVGGGKGAWDSFSGSLSRAATMVGRVGSAIQALAQTGMMQGAGLEKIRQILGLAPDTTKPTAVAIAAGKASVAGTAVANSLDPDFAAKQALKDAAGVLTAGAAGAAAQKDTAAYNAQATALANVNRARDTYISETDRAHQMSQLDAQAEEVRSKKETAATRAELGAIAAKKKRLELAGQVMSAAKVDQAAADAALVASSKQSKSSNSHAEALAREAAAMVANAKGAIALGEAYLQSDAAAIKAEADRKAATDGTRKGIDLAAQARRQLNLDIAEGVAASDKEIASLRAQAAAQAFANLAVASGAKTVADAAKDAADALALRNEIARAEAAHEVVVRQGAKATADEIAADKAATQALKDKKAALDAGSTGQNIAQAQISLHTSQDQAEVYKLEASLLFASNQERAKRLAMLQKEQELRNKPGGAALVASPEGQAAIKAAGDAAAAGAGLGDAQFIKTATDAVTAQRDAYLLNAKAIGMTTEQVAAFDFEQGHLNEAALRGITLTDDQTAALHKQAGQYGEVAKAAQELERQQKAAADAAAYLSDEVSGALEDVLTGSAKASEAVKSLATDLEKALIHGALTGEGPFAGILGTNKTDGPGQANHGLLSQMFGKAFGQGKAPTGSSPTDAIWVQMAGTLGGGSSTGLESLFGGANLGAPSGAGVGSLGDGISSVGDVFAQAGGDTFLSGLSGVFKDNSSGGFVGALKGIFGGLGGAGGGGGIGSWLSGLLKGGGSGGGIGSWISGNQGSIGAVLGSIAASVAHDGQTLGSGGPTRHVSPTIFWKAPRYHGGGDILGPDEVPLIGLRGERMLNRREAAEYRSGGNRPVNIYVTAKDSDSFRKSDRQIAGSMKRRLAVA